MSELTPFEQFKLDVQNQIDFMVSKFQNATQKFEESEKTNQLLSKDNQNIMLQINVLQSRVDSLCVDIENLTKTHNITCSSQEEKLKNVVTIHEGNISLIDTLRNDLLGVVKDGFDIKDKIKDFIPNFVDLKNQLEKLSFQIVNAVENSNLLKEPVNFCKSEIEKIQVSLTNKDSFFTILSNTLNDFTHEFSKYKNDVQETIKNHAELIQNLDGKINYSVSDIVKQINNKIDSIPKPVIPSIDNVKKEFSKLLEPVSLDSRNANLRAVNNETRVNLAEKRIEQIQLLLNQYNLQSQ